MNPQFLKHIPIYLVVTLFVILATLYSLVTPIFEASDEISHYPVVQHIATTGQLPIQRPGTVTLWEQEGSQPPLYYVLGAVLTSWIDTSDLPEIRDRNPHAKIGLPSEHDNKNMILHTEAEVFPWRGTILAVHLIRFLGILLGATSVALTYYLSLRLWEDNYTVASFASAIMAFNPMFMFITASVNNDNLTITLGMCVLLLVTIILQIGITPLRVALIGLATALLALTKISGLTFVPLVVAGYVIRGWHTRSWRSAVMAIGVLTLIWAGVAGWWYWRNLQLYGEPLGLEMQVRIAGGRTISLLGLAQEWYGFWVSFWALFGAVNVLADPLIYQFYALITVAAPIGLVMWMASEWRQGHKQDVAIAVGLLAQIGLVFVGVVRWTLVTFASQGRLMFPVLGIISILMAIGLVSLAPERWHKSVATFVSAIMMAIAIGSPFWFIAPAYVAPPVVMQVPEQALPVMANFGGLELMAIEVSSLTIRDGERVPITLYWRANAALDKNYSLYVHALGRNNSLIGKLDSYPGGGLLPTSRMTPGQIVKDYYLIQVDSKSNAPSAVRLQIGVGIWSPNFYEVVEPSFPDEATATTIIVDSGVVYPRDTETCTNLIEPDKVQKMALLDDFALLWGNSQLGYYRAGEPVEVSLWWDQLSTTTNNWTVFVHLINSTGEILAQADGPPVSNDYPTSLWRIPCQIRDMHTLLLPSEIAPGTYHLLVGLYDAQSPNFDRMEAFDLAGTPLANDAVVMGTITVVSK